MEQQRLVKQDRQRPAGLEEQALQNSADSYQPIHISSNRRVSAEHANVTIDRQEMNSTARAQSPKDSSESTHDDELSTKEQGQEYRPPTLARPSESFFLYALNTRCPEHTKTAGSHSGSRRKDDMRIRSDRSTTVQPPKRKLS